MSGFTFGTDFNTDSRPYTQQPLPGSNETNYTNDYSTIGGSNRNQPSSTPSGGPLALAYDLNESLNQQQLVDKLSNQYGNGSNPTELNTGGLQAIEYISSVDKLFVHQKVEMFEALTGFEQRNQYIVMNSSNQPVFVAREESLFLSRT